MSVAALRSALADPANRAPLTDSTLVSVAAGAGKTVQVARERPEVLAAAAGRVLPGITLEEYSLARCIASEGYGSRKQPANERELGRTAAAVGVAQCILNEARHDKVSVTAELTNSIFPDARGLYGQQRGRFAATTQDPNRWHGLVARAVLAGDVPDIAAGSRRFLHPEVFDGGVQAGEQLLPLEQVMNSRAAEGFDWRGQVATIDPYYLVFLRPGGTKASRALNVQRVMSIFREGQAGRSAPAPGDPDDSVSNIGALLSILAMGTLAYWVIT